VTSLTNNCRDNRSEPPGEPKMIKLADEFKRISSYKNVAERQASVEDPQTPTNGKLGLQASLF
jgi:hypothetical protein